MFRRVADFLKHYERLSTKTQNVLDAITDESLTRSVADDHRTLGRIAWHVVQTIPEMMGRTGLRPEGPADDDPVPDEATTIAEAYRRASRSLLEQIEASWTDATLEVEDELYGMRWPRASTATVLIEHEIHHTGQMTVLMRQAGLKPPGLYGPAKEDWATMKMEPPRV